MNLHINRFLENKLKYITSKFTLSLIKQHVDVLVLLLHACASGVEALALFYNSSGGAR